MKFILTIAAFAGLLVTASAQTTSTTTTTIATIATTATTGSELKEHVCSASCTAEVHAYMHGEKDHACAEACKTAAAPVKKAAGCCAGKKEGASCTKGASPAETHAGSAVQ